MNYDKEKHIEMLSSIINRIGNNHNSWSIATMTSMVGSFTALGLFNNKNNSILMILVIIFLIIIHLICLSLSLYYLKMERSYRNIQSSAIKGEQNSYFLDYKDKLFNEPLKKLLKKRSVIVYALLIITTISIVLDILIPIIKTNI